ncbi:FHA domain-containing protein [Sporomusa termitida]|uniref:Type VI secretion system FHA domain protein n=1 Tax=Sporomusa termitida TaxID=2377 RepID=A0A517DTK2_9FIRM|nr:FHA domain-containing protein [Sporomusa termitida]QDR80671.1 type VI secretion system FHA domain protein [Sporomusa termitida]
MPGKIHWLSIVAITLQYSLVLLLYYFLYRVIKIAAKDLARQTTAPQVRAVAWQEEEGTGSNELPKLLVIDDSKNLLAQTVYPIAESLAIGRSQHNDVVINDSFVSYEHACISTSKQTYLLADLNSTNGTLLNGQRIEEETALADGDIIQIGAVTLKFAR